MAAPRRGTDQSEKSTFFCHRQTESGKVSSLLGSDYRSSSLPRSKAGPRIAVGILALNFQPDAQPDEGKRPVTTPVHAVRLPRSSAEDGCAGGDGGQFSGGEGGRAQAA